MMLAFREKHLTLIIALLLLCCFTLSVFSQINAAIEDITALIDKDSENPKLYIKRGDAYFEQGEFFDAVEDYTLAIELNSEAYQAYFGRGMARARQGLIDEGIDDLSAFIKHNPKSSLAYTKRGVRYIWKQDFDNAEKDLTKAIELDPENAEAHDDIGVIYARKQMYNKAVEHFSTTVRIDPSYQKGFHNLAMTFYLVEQDAQALAMVNRSIALNANHRDSKILKSIILEKLGRYEESKSVREEAEFLPETNWSEGVPVQ